MKIIDYLFNDNLGYFIKEFVYQVDSDKYVGYILCQGYRLFGVYGYVKISHCFDMNELNCNLIRLSITL